MSKKIKAPSEGENPAIVIEEPVATPLADVAAEVVASLKSILTHSKPAQEVERAPVLTVHTYGGTVRKDY